MQAIESYRENPFLVWDACPSRPLDDAGSQEGLVLPRVDYQTLNVEVGVLGFVDVVFELNIDAYGELYFGLGVGLSDPIPFSVSLTEGYVTGYSQTPSQEIMNRILTGFENQAAVGAGGVGGFSAAFRDISQFSEPAYSRSAPLHGFSVEAGLGTPQIGTSVNYSWRIGNIQSILNNTD